MPLERLALLLSFITIDLVFRDNYLYLDTWLCNKNIYECVQFLCNLNIRVNVKLIVMYFSIWQYYILGWAGYPALPVIKFSHSCRIFELSPSLITTRKYAFISVGRLFQTQFILVMEKNELEKYFQFDMYCFNFRRHIHDMKIEHKIWYTLYEILCCSMSKKFSPFLYTKCV